MFAKYIIRLDDACPTMHYSKWNRMEKLLNKYEIKPVVAVIPNCKDQSLKYDMPDANFWDKVREWQSLGWDIALHGYDHVYTSSKIGLVPLSNKSEFSGLSLENQKNKIKKGISIFKNENIKTKIWIAPSHSFDENTLTAIRSETDIKIISDGIALFPFKKYDFSWVPQQIWHFRKMFFGVWTSCFHPNTMKDQDFKNLENFINKNKKSFVKVSDFDRSLSSKTLVDLIFERIYWLLKNKKT